MPTPSRDHGPAFPRKVAKPSRSFPTSTPINFNFNITTTTMTSKHIPFIPNSYKLVFVAEGAANAVYEIHPSKPPPPSPRESYIEEYGETTPPPSIIDVEDEESEDGYVNGSLFDSKWTIFWFQCSLQSPAHACPIDQSCSVVSHLAFILVYPFFLGCQLFCSLCPWLMLCLLLNYLCKNVCSHDFEVT